MKAISFLALALSSAAIQASEQPVTSTSTAVIKVTVPAPYFEIRLRSQPDESTLRDMRKILEQTGRTYTEARPDGGANIIIIMKHSR